MASLSQGRTAAEQCGLFTHKSVPVIFEPHCISYILKIIKEIEQNQLTWYGHFQRMAEERLPKIALNWMPKQKRARGRSKKNWMEGIKKAMNERNLNDGQWEDRKQWCLGVGQRIKTF